MDLPKLLDLLHSRELYLRRADGFSDRLEGALFPTLRASIDKSHAEGVAKYDANSFYRRARLGTYVSCWTMSCKDSMALWQLYGDVRSAVAITTTVDRLIQNAFSWDRSAHLYRVKYVDHVKTDTYVIGSYADVLQYKHEAYRYEKELRLIVPQQSDTWEENRIELRLPIIDLNTLIRSVVVAPEAGNEYFEAVKELCSRFDLSSPVRRSKLSFVPT